MRPGNSCRLDCAPGRTEAAWPIAEIAQRIGPEAGGGQDSGAGDRTEIVEIGLDPRHGRGRQRITQLCDSVVAIRAGDDDLGEHRVVERRNFGAGLDPGVDAHMIRKPDLGQLAGAGLEVRMGNFGVDAGLDRRAYRNKRTGRPDDILASRLPDHPFHEIDAEDGFRHRMFTWSRVLTSRKEKSSRAAS